MSWIKRKVFLMIAILLPTLVAIFILEIFLKVSLGLGQPIVYDKSSIWGYSPRAQSQYERIDGDIVTINDIGLRSTSMWNSNNNNKILFLGDSVTYGGSYISDNQVFSELACRDLNGYSCFNGGVNAYGILNMVVRSRFDSRLENSDIVVFVFIWGDFLRGLQKSGTAHFILRKPPKYFPAIWEVLNFMSTKYVKYLKFGKAEDFYNEDFNDPYLVASFAYENLKTEVSRLKSLGKKVVIISSPSIDEILGVKPKWVKKIENELINDFPNSYHSLLSEKLIKAYTANTSIFKDSVHLEQQGHTLYGEIINSILSEYIVLPRN